MKICSAKAEITESPTSFKQSLGFSSVEIEQARLKDTRVGKVVGVGRDLRRKCFLSFFLELSMNKLKEPAKAMAAETSQDKNFNERKQLLCTYVIHFCTHFAVYCKTTT